ncbi:branched-chain amino acid transport system substrate-binding protein [Actinocorallia herbida]|uniref:Branched-chain amino acid transport system substrate-binding protein n=1 Tax=Actinocorallia herbida TaxID=58109 RepID=A0A3N1D1D3_9ACTN|nr:ABC transporter substrate-binding protein [Actinocorallia herbida]ROO87345.1 branched-chain amino acid transport system substrate-binding protein [Actinocorallia herbida]
MKPTTHKGSALSRVLLSAGMGLLLTAAAACGGADQPSDEPTLTGEPIKVGLFNPDKGAVAVPAVKSGMDAAVSYIAKELKGVKGRPIVVESCSVDGTPESTIGCANKFVQEGVVAAFDGFNLSSSAGIGILEAAKIPLVGQIPFDQTTGSTASGRVFLGSPQASFLVGALQGFKAEGKTSATLTLVDTPSSHKTVETQLIPLAKAIGIKATGLYFSPTNPNFSALAATIASTKPDVAGLIASPNASICTQLIKNLRSVGYSGSVFVAACTAFIKSDPADAPGATLYSSVWLPGTEKYAPKAAVDNLKVATEYVSKTSGPPDFYAYAQFATVVDFARALAAAPSLDNLTGATVLSTLQGLKDFDTFLGPKITCGKATTPNCTTQMLLFTVQDDLTLKPVTGDWITPLPAIMANIPGAS